MIQKRSSRKLLQWSVLCEGKYQICGETSHELPAGGYSCEVDHCGTPLFGAETGTYETTGDAWWNLANNEFYKDYRSAMIARAQYQYVRALESATGITEAKIEKRIEEAKTILLEDEYFINKLSD